MFHESTIAVEEHGRGTAVGDRVGRGDKRKRRGDHAITGFDTQHLQRQVKGRSPATERDRMRYSHEGGDLRLKPIYLGP